MAHSHSSTTPTHESHFHGNNAGLKMPLCFYLLIIDNHGHGEGACCPPEQVCRLLGGHVNQHTLGHQQCWQTAKQNHRERDFQHSNKKILLRVVSKPGTPCPQNFLQELHFLSTRHWRLNEISSPHWLKLGFLWINEPQEAPVVVNQRFQGSTSPKQSIPCQQKLRCVKIPSAGQLCPVHTAHTLLEIRH